MIKLHAGLFALCLVWAALQTSSAQEVVFSDGSSTWTLGSAYFTTNAEGVSTLSDSCPNYVENLATDSGTVIPVSLGLSGGGWVFNNPDGTVVITNSGGMPNVALADPFVSYGYYFINNAGTTQPFSMQFTTNFPDLSFSSSQPGLARAAFGVTLTDGSPGPGATSASASVTQTATLAEVAAGSVLYSTSADADLGPANEFVTNGGTTSSNFSTANFPNFNTGPSGGPYNQLVVTVSGTYSPDAIAAVSGRVDVVPEPHSLPLLFVGAIAGVIFHLRRNMLR